MTSSPTDVIQSFRLRFWRESRRGICEDWRGDVWHEQQNPDEEAVVVANPDAAFELIRQTLRFFSETPDRRTAPDETGSVSPGDARPGTIQPKNPLLSIWRNIRGEKP